MTINIERIKAARLGRVWLAAFVARVWEHVLTPTQHDRVRSAERVKGKVVIDSSHRTGVGVDLAVVDLEDLELIEVDWRRFKRLTPLGVEVYLYGREQAGKQARKRGGR